MEVFARWRAVSSVTNVNIGITLTDRASRVIFGRSWVNADIEPLNLNAGDEVVTQFKLELNIEPGECAVMLSAIESLRDGASANGWNQHVGGARYCELPRAATLTVLPRTDGRNLFFGMACLQNSLHRQIKRL